MIFSSYAGVPLPRDDPDQDMDGVSHTVEVTAAALSEALAPGLAATNRFAGIARGSTSYVSVANVRVEHEVKPLDFTKWLERTYATGGKRPSLYLINPRPPL